MAPAAYSQASANTFLDAAIKRLGREDKNSVPVNGKLSEREAVIADICPIGADPSARRIFLEYGAMYIAADSVRPPLKCIFASETEVKLFQESIPSQSVKIDGVTVTLQSAAMDALLEARKEAAQMGLRISARGGATASKRSYEDTRRLWESRFYPGLAYWVKKGKLQQKEADDAKQLSTARQIAQALEWEDARGTFFNTDFSKSILYSVAAPGASQHIAMLAMDVEQYGDKRVRAVMAKHGWFQTVKSDQPHFTYLGLKESDLPAYGLKKSTLSGQDFWVPDFK
jgi:hypothetical protein